MRVSRIAIIAGVVAAVMTCTSFWSETALGSIVGDTLLGWGLILASIPFGGLHDNPPVFLVFAMAALINGVLWGGLTSLAVAALRFLRQLRTP
jgi:hypothetical protein